MRRRVGEPRVRELGPLQPPRGSSAAGEPRDTGCEKAWTIFRLNVPAAVNILLVADFLHDCCW